MKKFMVIYHAPDAAMWEAGNSSPEEMKKGMEAWMDWAKKCGSNLIDMGSPLSGGQKLFPNNKSVASNKEVLGYSILQADNIEKAKTLLENHPHLNWRGDCEIEIHEMMPTPA